MVHIGCAWEGIAQGLGGLRFCWTLLTQEWSGVSPFSCYGPIVRVYVYLQQEVFWDEQWEKYFLMLFFCFWRYMRKNTSIFVASCFKCDWQFALLEFIWHLLEFAFADSNVLFLIFFSYMNLLRVFLKSLLKIWAHKDSHGYWAGQREAGQDEQLAAADGLEQFPSQAVLCYRWVAETLAGFVNHPSHPTPAPPPCHSCPGCAQGQRSHIMQN